MKKFNESQLLDKVRGLREYLAITEADALSPNPYANDPKQAAIYATLSPADQAWATKGGGKPDLTDKYIAARAPNKFKPVAPAPQNTGSGSANNTTIVPQQAPAQSAMNQASASTSAPANTANSMGVSPHANVAGSPTAVNVPAAPAAQGAIQAADIPKVARFKELIAKAGGAPAAEKRTPAEIKASADLGSFAGESVSYFLNKLRLLEGLTPEEQKELDTLSSELAGYDGVDTDVSDMLAKYKTLPRADAAKNPTADNAATAIPSGGLENPANQEAPATAAANPNNSEAGMAAGGGGRGGNATPADDNSGAPPVATDATSLATAQSAAGNQTGTTAGPAAADNSGAPPAAATNFDSMPFGKAFATAKAQGLKQFTWKGKPYAVKMAATAATKPPANKATVSNAVKTSAEQQVGAPAGTYGESTLPSGQTVYSEDQSLARIIQLARSR
jgi:hypothetical protein